jgi:hypothetical protein
MDRDTDRINADTAPTDPLAERKSQWRRALVAGRVGHRPSPRQREAIDLAAHRSAYADAVAADPKSTVNDIVRADGNARRARAELDAVLSEGQRSEPPLLYDEIMRADA